MLIFLGVVVWIIVLLGAIGSGEGGGAILVLVVGVLLYFGISRTGDGSLGGASGKDDMGRLVLRPGSDAPVQRHERSRLLEDEIGRYMRDGYFVRDRTETTAQLVKPKQFSFLWALLWFLVVGIGLIVYLIYYAAKRDEGRYVEVDGYGAVKATRQVHHVL